MSTMTSRSRQLSGLLRGAYAKRYWVKLMCGKRTRIAIYGRKVVKWIDQEGVLLGPFRSHKQAEAHMIDVLGHPCTVPGTVELLEGETA